MRLSVIIVSYNVKHFLEQCLYSVMPAIKDMEAEVLVVDNDSPDKSVDYLRPLFPGVVFIQAGDNIGFARANNLALARARGEYILFLNPDTLVPENCFDACISFFEAKQGAGALGVKMLDGSGCFLPESKRSFPNTSVALYKATGLARIFPKSRRFNRYALGYLDPGKAHSVEVLAGAFFMTTKSVLEITGPFDEVFFMYGEDIDLSYRIKKAGYDNWYFPGSPIIHFKGESAKKGSPYHVKVFYNAMIVFVKKHYNGSGSGFFKLLLFGGINAKAFVSLVKGTFSKKKKRPGNDRRTVIVGTMEEYDECNNIYRLTGITKDIVGRIAVTKDDVAGIGHYEEIKECCEKHEVHEVVFCQGVLQYAAIIHALQRLGPSYSFRFHASGSNSIVGSDFKSDLGDVVALS